MDSYTLAEIIIDQAKSSVNYYYRAESCYRKRTNKPPAIRLV